MKIHEKLLTHYLSCPSPVDKEGYLYKKERPADRHLLGVIVLEGCIVQPNPPEGQFCFSLVFTGPGLRTYGLAADDCLGQESWVHALHSASHTCLSLLVKELGRLYEEAKRVSGESSQSPPVTEKGLNQSMATFNPGSSYSLQGKGTAMRDPRAYGGSHTLPAPLITIKTTNKRSPKLWPKRNALVTPLNGPAPTYGEWPLVGSDTLEDFSKLHEHYGDEVRQLRADWLRRKHEEEGHIEEDLIDLG
ncbi:sesquipedalian-1 isoform X2 [Clupea harengus]|uniref:Sesquipedalian n=1 Tax=Clupea harengus TaxID=7950 RepID=A0A6P8FYM1_CLUHA|nr:sesquipedalian-1 isoform X2 [Clupea harengus]